MTGIISMCIRAACYLISSEDAISTEVLDGIPGHLDLEGRQCCGIDAGRSHCGLCEESERGKGQNVRLWDNLLAFHHVW